MAKNTAIALFLAAVAALLLTVSDDTDRRDRSVRLLAVGDSITDDGYSFAYRLHSLFPIRIVAENGAETGWMVERLNGVRIGGYTHLIVLGGMNDVKNGGLEAAKANLETICRMGRAAGLTVIAITVNPWGGHPDWTESLHRDTLSLNRRLEEMRDEGLIDRLIDFHAAIADPNDPTRMASRFTWPDDSLHPNRAAHRLLAEMVRQAILGPRPVDRTGPFD